jgi:type I restriction enzyme, S subunit
MKQGWEIRKLGEVCQYEKLPNRKSILPYVGLEDIESNTGKFTGYLEPKKVKSLTYYFTPEHVLYGRLRPYLNKVILPDFEGHCSTEIFPIRPKAILNKNYLFHWLIYNETVNKINATWSGATLPRANMKAVLEFEIPIPPLPEQQCIVSIIDEAFASIAKAKANAEQNLNNAKELFESYLLSVFANKSEGWEEKTLNDICEVKDGTHESPKYLKDGIPFVTQKNIRQYGLSFDDTKFITQADHDKFYKRSNVAFGDILISMIGVNRGMAAIVDDNRVFSIKNVGLIKENQMINKHFLLYYLKSSFAMKYVKYMSNGGAQEFVGLTALRAFPIPYPRLEEQQTIVLKLDELSAETKKLETIYQQKLNDLEELKKSILQKAFNGELKTA